MANWKKKLSTGEKLLQQQDTKCLTVDYLFYKSPLDDIYDIVGSSSFEACNLDDVDGTQILEINGINGRFQENKPLPNNVLSLDYIALEILSCGENADQSCDLAPNNKKITIRAGKFNYLK